MRSSSRWVLAPQGPSNEETYYGEEVYPGLSLNLNLGHCYLSQPFCSEDPKSLCHYAL